MKKVIGYIRVSSNEQAKKYSLGGQKSEIEGYCKKKDYFLTKIFTDASSGFNFERKELQELLDFVEKKHKDLYAIIYTERDRLLRDPEISGYIKYVCYGKNVKLIAINEEIEEEKTESKELYESMMGIIAKYESKRRVRRSIRGKREKFEIYNTFIGSIAPYGYRMKKINDKKVPVPDENAINVIGIFKDFKHREVGYLKLAKKYNIKHLNNKKEETSFAPMKVRFILHNPFYIGYIKRTKPETKKIEWKKGNHKPLIEKETFFKIKGNDEIKKELNIE